MSEPLTEVPEPTPEPTEPTPEPEPEPEPEEGELEPDTEPEQPEGEPAAPESLAMIEEIGKKLDGLNKHVARRMGEILGEDAAIYVPCELCSPFQTPGWRPQIEPPPDVIAALWHLLGQRSPTDLLPDPHSKMCPECNGEGEVDMRSKVQGQTSLACVLCGAKGWLPTDDTRRDARPSGANGPAVSGQSVAATEPASAPIAQPLTAEAEAAKKQGYLVIPMGQTA